MFDTLPRLIQSSRKDLTTKNESRHSRTLRRTCSFTDVEHRFKITPENSATSQSQSGLDTEREELTVESSVLTATCDESQTIVGLDVEKLLVEETSALRELAAQLGLLERLCHEQLSWKQKVISLQNRLKESKTTIRNLCLENVKVS